MTVEFGLLGPLLVADSGTTVQLRASKQRELLASLLVDVGRVVRVEELMRRLWDSTPPAGARNALQNHVLRLRQALGELHQPLPLVSRPEGYLLDVAEDTLDLRRFADLIDLAGKALAEGNNPERAAQLLDTALRLWRGDPFSDVPSDALHREVVPILIEQHLLALELRVDANLQLGRHAEMVSELQRLTVQYPLREALWAHRMIALYRCGRSADALQCYRTLTTLLAEELAIEPGPEVRRLQHAILVNDPALEAPIGAAYTSRMLRPCRNDLPADVTGFVGRTGEVQQIATAAEAASGEAGGETRLVVVAIDGMAGVGKTALAVRAAHRFAGDFTDGQLFIDLHGHSVTGEPTPPSAALDALLRALGVPGSRIPDSVEERSAAWRAELAGRRLLLVLDDAATAAQVRPLLPGTAGCLVVVTSRRRLPDLDTSCTVSLDVFPPADADRLFTKLVGADRVRAGGPAGQAVSHLCGYLPLAIRIAGARLRSRPSWTPGHLVQRLQPVDRRLVELRVGDRSVAAAFAVSYRRLPPEGQRLYRLLGLLPTPAFDVRAAAGVAGSGVETVLEDLADAHLVEPTSPGRYRMHALAWCHARTLDALAEPGTAVRRESA